MHHPLVSQKQSHKSIYDSDSNSEWIKKLTSLKEGSLVPKDHLENLNALFLQGTFFIVEYTHFT